MKRFFTFFLAFVASLSLASVMVEVNAMQIASSEENVYFSEYSQDMGRSINFDSGWKFYYGDSNGFEEKDYDDSTWRDINLPHDYSIEQDFSRANGNEAESGFLGGGVGWYRKSFRLGDTYFTENKRARIDFDGVYMDSKIYINGHLIGSHPYGYTPFSFDITKYIERGDNVIAVRVNHELPSSRWYSGSGIYRSVHLTLLDNVHVDLFGSKVEATNLSDNNRSDVNLKITTDIKNASGLSKDLRVGYELIKRNSDGSEGEALKHYDSPDIHTISSNSTLRVESSFNVSNPKLWSVDNPNLYYVKTIITVGSEIVDTYKEEFGFRYFKFDPALGFSLNGERMKLKGVCMHHDQGSLGSIANKDAQMRQIRILKEMGANAIRVTHNPASQTLIEAANEMGILLIEEAFDGWNLYKNSNFKDYHRFFNEPIGEENEIYLKEGSANWHEFDLRMQIKRGVNSPAIIAWSLGNEIWEGTNGSWNDWEGILRSLISVVQSIDTTRPCTTGDNRLRNDGGNSLSIRMSNINTENNGIVGMNYCSGEQMDRYHRSYPNWALYASETSSAINSRGVYHTTEKRQDSRLELTSYDESTVGWGTVSSVSWDAIQRRDFVAGEFIWTGFDYIGEPTDWNELTANPGGAWPAPKNSFFGILDTAGLPKDRYYFYQSQWRKDITTLHMLPAWDKDILEVRDGDNVRVDIYSNAPEVRLYLDRGNGKELIGASSMNEIRSSATANGDHNGYYTFMARGNGSSHKDLYHTFNVPYHDGTLSVEAYDRDGRKITNTSGISERKTAGEAYMIKASVEEPYKTIKSDNDSLAYIRLDIVDRNGNIVPNANNRITTKVSSNGLFRAMDNGKQADVSKYSNTSRDAYHGSEIAIVSALDKKPGAIMVEFTSPGLKKASVKINVEGVGSEAGGNAPIGMSLSKNYVVKLGTTPSLPNKIALIYGDGHKEERPVSWTNLDTIDFNTVGIKTIKGIVDNKYRVSISANVIDKIGGVYSYSAYSRYNEIPRLPERLEAYDIYGNAMKLFVDIAWDMPECGAFERFGIVNIKGSGNLLGDEISTVAKIAIRESTVEETSNLAPLAFKREQDKPNNNSFDAIFDNNIILNDNDYWTNYDPSLNGDTDSVIKLSFATQQTAKKAEITFFRDNWSCVYPRPQDLKIEYLANNEDASSIWNALSYEVSIGSEVENSDGRAYKTYTYSFNKPINLTTIKFIINNHPTDKIGTRNAVTGITELKLIGAKINEIVGSEAKLSALRINGYSLNASEINKGSFDIEDSEASLVAEGYMNSAVTILPKVNDKILIKIVAEDKASESLFTINLNKRKHNTTIDSNSNAFDYKASINVEAPEAELREEYRAIEFMNDKDNATFYHSKWSTNLRLRENNHAIILDLGKEISVAGLRYLPRAGASGGVLNGRLSDYEVWLSADGGNYKRVASGHWDNNEEWKLASFNEEPARYVKLVCKGSYGDSNSNYNRFINCAELRVIDGSLLRGKSVDSLSVLVEPTRLARPNLITRVMDGDKELINGYDYITEFSLVNGRGKCILTGINEYSGTKEVAFDLLANLSITKINLLGLNNNSYIGDIINAQDIILEISYSNNTTLRINDINILGDRIMLIKGFNTPFKAGINALELRVDNYTYNNEIYAIRGDLAKAIDEAVIKYSVDLNNYEAINQDIYMAKLNALKALKNSSSLDKDVVVASIRALNKAYNSLEKKKAFMDLETKASLVISYLGDRLTGLKLRFGGRIDNNLLDLANKSYGVIVVANSSNEIKNSNSISVELLNELKQDGFAHDIIPEGVEGKEYHQFAWVITNIPEERYSFSFTAYLYEVDKINPKEVRLAHSKTCSVMDVVNTYLERQEELKLPEDVIRVLEGIIK